MAGNFSIDGKDMDSLLKLLLGTVAALFFSVCSIVSLSVLFYWLQWSIIGSIGLALLPGALIGVALGIAVGRLAFPHSDGTRRTKGTLSFDLENHYKPILITLIVVVAVVFSAIYYYQTGGFAPLIVTLVGCAATAIVGGKKLAPSKRSKAGSQIAQPKK